MSIQALSDLHIDYSENLKWLQGLSRLDYQQDTLILGGDISHEMKLIETAFYHLKKIFKEVIFVPGNHDLWIAGNRQLTSLQKFDQIRRMAAVYGVHTSTLYLDNVTIIPLLGWYDYSFGQPTEIAIQSWQDFYACNWAGFNSVAGITQHFLALNETNLALHRPGIPTITFSHFLPRIDLMPDYIPADRRIIYPFLGSNGLEAQIRKVNPIIHIYGHSHVNVKRTIDDVFYINNAFGYPEETRITAKQLLCVHDSN
ncbi:metallophosphoesterase family protein [Chitinophaga nivalis]|uniref:Metallophosphoesterase n=1 Tax=Chitinophaga nivalis TaxID=2991709 RepID=A0ABT3IKH1_9BACT|nr:metallophosphoesterase [Chitinophaga nivalis]MCW3466009.1 metallophosphoesterase [Chitinophaga nivalis]MCW3484300.1 metallophosphoesterase [Chitinophaga nivalis]